MKQLLRGPGACPFGSWAADQLLFPKSRGRSLNLARACTARAGKTNQAYTGLSQRRDALSGFPPLSKQPCGRTCWGGQGSGTCPTHLAWQGQRGAGLLGKGLPSFFSGSSSPGADLCVSLLLNFMRFLLACFSTLLRPLLNGSLCAHILSLYQAVLHGLSHLQIF